MKMPWFRAYTKMVDDEKLRLLAFEDRWHFVAILCLKGAGVLDENDPLLMRKVAVKLGLDLRALDEAVRAICWWPKGWRRRKPSQPGREPTSTTCRCFERTSNSAGAAAWARRPASAPRAARSRL